MTKTHTPLLAEEVRRLLDYNPETGMFKWKIDRGGKARTGTVAGNGTGNRGYWTIGINGVRYRVHRIAWLHYYGELPKYNIDHIDGDVSNNRISNLRDATQSQNMWNSKINSNNTSGIKGVRWNSSSRKWQASTRFGGKERHLGYFTDIKEAEKAVKSAREIHHGEFARHS